MTAPWRHAPYTFRALKETFGRLWVRCDSCRRYAPLKLEGLLEVDYRTKTFSCSRCGGSGTQCIIEPIKETGMGDYRLDPVPGAQRHARAVERLTGATRHPQPGRAQGELPGRKIDLRR